MNQEAFAAAESLGLAPPAAVVGAGSPLDSTTKWPFGHVRSLAGKLVVLPDVRPAIVEQYRKLAATLHFAKSERSVKVVMVASSVASEGKTFTSCNLALTLSESYQRRVLLIDADLRRPSVHDIFQLPNVFGLSTELENDGARLPAMISVSDNLQVITGGPPNHDPTAGLTSPRMRQIIESAAAAFDWVIIDTPPIGLLTDAKLLAGMVDTALLVIKANSTPYAIIKRSVETLGRDRILGTVLNQVADDQSGGYHYYGYYGHYGPPRG